MKKTRLVSSLREEAIYRPIIAKHLAEIDHLHEMMKRDDIEIARSQAQTQEVLAEIEAMHTSSERKQEAP